MPTDRRILYGHHFAAIAGAGPLVGPVLSAQMGYLSSTIWIIVGVCTLIVMIVACICTVQALRGHNITNTEDPAKPSRLFAPSGLIANKAEKDLQAEWDEFWRDQCDRQDHNPQARCC